MTPEINDLAASAGVSFFDYQLEFLEAVQAGAVASQRACLYYKTGAGKSLTALAGIALWGHDRALVVAPPSTHQSWAAYGTKLGIEVEAISHAKFRMKDTRLSRDVPIIADEMHMFGGHKGQGWKKLDRLAAGLRAPLVMASATPNYNDAERVYCIQHVLDPLSCRGGFLEFVYRNCETEQNPFGMEPKVTGFRNYPDAAAYLAQLPGVFYLPDDLTYTVQDVEYHTPVPWAYEVFGYVERNGRLIASQIEERHTRMFLQLVDEHGFIHDHVYQLLEEIAGSATTPLLVYANHSTVAEALGRSLNLAKVAHQVVTGSTSKAEKQAIIDCFIDGQFDVLVGTATLATGTDGLDKVCDWLVILDDTDDDALRRQLIGRIMPRGEGGDASTKSVIRLVHDI